MKTRPYVFTAPWALLTGAELVAQGIGGVSSAHLCTTEDGACILREGRDGSWFAGLIGNGEDNRGANLRYYWTTKYRHGHKKLTFDEAKDLGEAALVAASVFGIHRVGSYEGGCVL